MEEKPQAGGAALQVVPYGERLTGWLVIAHHSGHMSCGMQPTISAYQLAALGHIRRLARPHVLNIGMGTEMFYCFMGAVRSYSVKITYVRETAYP